MSTTVYLIRHGESEANNLTMFAGHIDVELTAQGKKQADVTAEYLEKQNFRPSAIYSSDLTRAYSTAESIAKRLNMPIVKNEGLREINAGEWEGVKFDELIKKFKGSYSVWLENIGRSHCDGGESVAELQKRVVSTVATLADKHKNEVIFVFTHATPIRVLAAHCMNKSLDEVKDIPWATNASVSKFIYDNGGFELVEYGRDDFMGELITKFASNV